MARIVQARDPELSLFQSAIDEIAIRGKAGGGAQSVGEAIASTDRPGVEDPIVRQAAYLIPDVEQMRADGQETLPQGPAPTGAVTEGIGAVAKYCAGLAFNLFKAKVSKNAALIDRYSRELSAVTGTCDPRYAEAAEQTLVYYNQQKGVIPYQQWDSLSDFVIDDGGVTLPEQAVVAIVADWGTGQQAALNVLARLAEKSPDVVIHLGDVYYSGTDIEQQNYFFDNWARILGLSVDPDTRRVTSKSPRTFNLPGNHDMYCGGAPYYKMIQQLGHRASYFCLRNKDWQFIGMDTGYNDHGLNGPPTHLPPRQPEWVQDKVTNSGGRKTVFLSHHQLFSNQESFTVNGTTGATNTALLADVAPVLGQVALWLWGHQHEFVAYADSRVKGRCMGHGGYPVGLGEIGKPGTAIPVDTAIALQQAGNAFMDNGYTLIALDGPTATVTYYALDENGDERDSPSQETI